MLKKSSLFLGLLTAYTLATVSPALALSENDAILVKVQDIVPTKDNRGMITGCEFLTTIYNRTDADLSELSFGLNWYDDAVQNTIIQEQNLNRYGRDNNMRGTDEFISPDVISTFNIPILKKNSQKSMRGKIDSDRCFILLEDARITVSSCKQNGQDNSSGNFSCQSLFRYISSKSPEYYTDFLAVSVETQKELDTKTKKRQSQELDTLFQNAEANLNKASRLLNTTVAPVNPLPAATTESGSSSGIVAITAPISAATSGSADTKADSSASATPANAGSDANTSTLKSEITPPAASATTTKVEVEVSEEETTTPEEETEVIEEEITEEEPEAAEDTDTDTDTDSASE